MATLSPTILPDLNPSLYTWSLHPTIPRLYLRPALGAESKWVHQPPESRQLYLTGRITFQTTQVSQLALFKAAEKAWLRLRFHYPEIVLRPSGSVNADGVALMQCEIPRRECVARDWLGRTFRSGVDFVGGRERSEMAAVEVEMRKEVVLDPVNVRLHAVHSTVPDSGRLMGKTRGEAVAKLVGAEWCLRVDHLLTDGIGEHILGSKFLGLLAEELGERQNENIDWAKAAENIPKAWVGMLNEKQRFGGKEFEETVRRNTALVLESMKSRWGLRIEPGDGYEPASVHRAFSLDQSKAIIYSVKERLGPAYSITHLGHAAMIMTMLKLKPPQDRPTDQNNILSPLFINGRRYLDPEQPEALDHLPLCRAMSAIEFLNVDQYILSSTPGKQEIHQKLRLACKEARRSYQRVRDQDSILTESFCVMKAMATAQISVEEDSKSAEAFLLSDGIVEQYLSRSYTDEGGVHEIFTLDDVRFTANPSGPALIIRMSSFRDVIRMSAEWNAVSYAEELVREFLSCVVELMLTFTEKGGTMKDRGEGDVA